MRLPRLRDNLPTLPPTLDASSIPDYLRRLATALAEWQRGDRVAHVAIDNPPVFVGALSGNQTLVANTLTTVQLAALIDTHSWYDAAALAYKPRDGGFYRCTWVVGLSDSGPIATTTYGQASVGSFTSIALGNGGANDVCASGATVIECDGSATVIKLEAILTAGSAPVVRGDAYRTWLTIEYLGRRALKGSGNG